MVSSTRKTSYLLVIGAFLLTFFVFNSRIPNLVYNNDNINEKTFTAQTSYNVGEDFFNATGANLNVTLYGNRSQSENLNIKKENLIINNDKNGWNISEFKLNITSIYASDASMSFEIRSDGSEEISEENWTYANSFEIPNSCHIRNLSMFIQYPGGTFIAPGIGKTEQLSIFSIRIYNATYNETKIIPDEPIDNIDEDKIVFNLTEKDHPQPARWYQSNFTSNNVLNISKTYNKTWFAVFNPLKIPSGGGFSSIQPYYYYAEEKEDDVYDIVLYKNNTNWNEQFGRNGMFKINFSPLEKNPNAKQMNISVFNTLLDINGVYFNNSYFPNDNNRFLIPISSPWFGDVEINVSFVGKFRFDTKSINTFKAVEGSLVFWNSTKTITEYPDNFYNKIVIFYKPSYWTYNQTYNTTEIFENVKKYSNHIYLENISNGNWCVSYIQANNIIDPNFQYSINKRHWNNLEDNQFINATDYINITSLFNNSNGDALLYVDTVSSPKEDLIFIQKIKNGSCNFPIWSPRYNTSILENDTLTQVDIMTNNGTMAGIISKNFRVLLQKNKTTLDLISNLKNSYIYGDQLNLEVSLQSNKKPLFGELVQFKITETFSGGITNEVILNDTTDDEGIARIKFSIKEEVNSIRINISYGGNLDYNTAEFTTSSLIVRSPTEQFFLDFFPYLILIIAGISGIISYYTIKRYKFKKSMEVWKKKTQLFADVLKIDLILVIHKESGACLIQKSFSDIPIDGNLISGFLQAVSSFKYEIKGDSERKKRESILLDYQDYNILLKDGEFIRLALILNSEPSENLKKSLNKFINEFEKKNLEHLKQYTGNVTPFQENFMDLVDKHFKMSFISPHIVNENPPAISLNTFQERIIAIAKTLQSDASQFYISQLLNYLLSAEPNEPKERFIANIYDLKEYGFIETA